MLVKNIGNRTYLRSNILSDINGIEHFFTTKPGGVSSGKITGLNLGFRVGDNPESVEKNYIHISEDFDIPFERITAAKQIHSFDVRVITENECGFGVSRLDQIFEADGLVTNCKNMPLMVFYADCVPILMVEESVGVVAAVHSGWRGTVSGIAKNAVLTMTEKFGARPECIKAVIGPSIGKCCFETGADVANNFENSLVERLPDGKFKVNLWEANRQILLKSGLNQQNIEVLGMCTMCHPELLYSYRAHGDSTGRMGAVIMLKEG